MFTFLGKIQNGRQRSKKGHQLSLYLHNKMKLYCYSSTYQHIYWNVLLKNTCCWEYKYESFIYWHSIQIFLNTTCKALHHFKIYCNEWRIPNSYSIWYLLYLICLAAAVMNNFLLTTFLKNAKHFLIYFIINFCSHLTTYLTVCLHLSLSHSTHKFCLKNLILIAHSKIFLLHLLMYHLPTYLV